MALGIFLQDLTKELGARLSWRNAGLLVLSGALSVLSMAPVFAWPILFITIPMLIWSLDHSADQTTVWAKFLSGFARGWLFGFGYFLAGLYWIAYPFLVEAEKFIWLLPFAVALLPAGLALFYGLAAAVAAAAFRSELRARVLGLAFAFGVLEWLRCWALTGFPWNLIGYALAPPGPMIHSAGLFGGVALSALVVLVASPLAFARYGLRAAIIPAGLSAAVLIAFAGYGMWVRSEPALVAAGPVMRLVQPNISQKDKLDRTKGRANLDLLLDISRRTPDGRLDDGAGARIIVWPESVFRFIVMEEPLALAALAGLVGSDQTLVTGAMRLDRGDGRRKNFRVWNSVFAFDGDANPIGTYDKLHLVPFGEYLPKQYLLEAIGLEQLTRIRGGFSKGHESQRFFIPGLPAVLSLVCYEIIFPFEVLSTMDGSGARPQWILNVTNDAWFGTSSGPYQHLHQSQLRAVELGIPVVRVANTGVSALIDGLGVIRAQLALNKSGSLDVQLPPAHNVPLFARWPKLITWSILLFCFLTAVAFTLRGRQVAVYDG